MRRGLALFLVAIFLLSPPGAPSERRCDHDPLVAALLEEGDPHRWVAWIATLSGAQPIQTDSSPATITTRYSFSLFDGEGGANAFTYLIQELEGMGFQAGTDFQVHTYDFPFDERYPERNWKNLILTFPGVDPTLQDERVLLVAHLDSISENPSVLAPGADDNASGAAGLLEAAWRLRHFQFSRTLHLIWFTGEEQSRVGSEHFVADYADWLPDVTALINLDMFAFDWDEDRCFEIHVGTLPGSRAIGQCLKESITAYDLDLRYDFIDNDSAYDLSDHAPFWAAGVPAVMLFENFFYQGETGCGVIDRNYHYHQTTDTLTYINAETGFAILQAAIAAAAHLAGPESSDFSEMTRGVFHPGILRSGIPWQPR